MSENKSLVSKLMGLTGLAKTEVTLQTNKRQYIGIGYRKSWLNPKTVMTELTKVVDDYKQSKYFPHQSYQECQRRLSKNG